MKKLIVCLTMYFSLHFTHAQQVPLQSVVEHFTNTKCSICASRNPGFYSNYNSTSGILHVSIHPSSPYSTCILSQQNTSDNDARTNHYGIYGGTPRLVINGDVIPGSANYSSSSLFSPYIGLSSSFIVKTTQTKIGTDSIKTRVVIYKNDTSVLSNANLFIGLLEDTVFVNGGNGEPTHFNVLRKSATTSSGMPVTLPAMINDSIVVNKTSYIKTFWNQNRMYSLAILQRVNNKLIQTGKSAVLSSNTGISSLSKEEEFVIYPNPASNYIYLKSFDNTVTSFELFNLKGELIKKGSVENEPVDVSAIGEGLYGIRIYNERGSLRKLICIQKN
jgi:hypothetical protein